MAANPPSGDHGISNNVDVFVDLAGLKSAVQVDVAVAGHEFAVDGVGELPFSCAE